MNQHIVRSIWGVYLVFTLSGIFFNISCKKKVHSNIPHFAYVTNEFGEGFGGGIVDRCQIDSATGDLFNCVDAGGTFAYPAGIAFHTADNRNTFAYIVLSGGNPENYMAKCLIDVQTGDFISCEDAGLIIPPLPPSVMIHLGLNIARNIYGQNYMYITAGIRTSEPLVIKCGIDENGFLTECVSQITGVDGDGSSGIEFLPDDNRYAYIVQGGKNFNFSGNSVSRCLVSKKDGSLSGCVDANATNLNLPFTLNFYRTSARTYAYIPNFNLPGVFINQNKNTITKCMVDFVTKDLVQCVDSGVGDIFTHPTVIDFL